MKELHSIAMAMQHLEFNEKAEYEKSWGILSSQIQVRLLESTVAYYPELDDLKDLR